MRTEAENAYDALLKEAIKIIDCHLRHSHREYLRRAREFRRTQTKTKPVKK